MRELVIGHDHGFGRGRSGDVDTLRHLGVIHGFDVDVVPPVDFGDQHVSSSRVRRAVAGGDLPSAARMLGRPYTVSGLVGHGEHRGRLIGVPTINLVDVPPQKLLPPDGVYAVRVEWRQGPSSASWLFVSRKTTAPEPMLPRSDCARRFLNPRIGN